MVVLDVCIYMYTCIHVSICRYRVFLLRACYDTALKVVARGQGKKCVCVFLLVRAPAVMHLFGGDAAPNLFTPACDAPILQIYAEHQIVRTTTVQNPEQFVILSCHKLS